MPPPPPFFRNLSDAFEDDDVPMGSSLLATAMRIACEKGSDDLRWMRVRELQLACVEVCAGCRQAAPFRVRINDDTPRRLWAAWSGHSYRDSDGGGGDRSSRTGGCNRTAGAGNAVTTRNETRNEIAIESTPRVWRGILVLLAWWMGRVRALFRKDLSDLAHVDQYSGGGGGSVESQRSVHAAGRLARGEPRVPRLRVISAVWEGSVRDMAYGGLLPRGLEDLVFYEDFDERVQEVRWPSTLKKIMFGRDFAQDVVGVVWPPCLEVLRFGFMFNTSVDDVVFPNGLKVLAFDWHFNQRLDRATFPPNLEEIAFGYMFYKPLDSVTFPSGLAKITFGERFNHSIDAVRWPRGLKSLTFGRRFNRSIQATVFPPGLRELKFGEYFDQELQEVEWPPALENIDLGGCSRDIELVVWPTGLKRLALGRRFDGRVGDLPAGLQHITFGRDFNGESWPVTHISWPVALETVEFRGFFNQSIADVVWPEKLKRVTFSMGFNRPLDDVVWPPELERIELCCRFKQPLDQVAWPPSLKTLKFCSGMHLWEGVQWPPGVRVEFSSGGHRRHEVY